MSRRTIITCDGCGCEDFPLPRSMGLMAIESRGVELRGPGDSRHGSFSIDLCPTCQLIFAQRWNGLNPRNWPRTAAREPMQQQEHTDA